MMTNDGQLYKESWKKKRGWSNEEQLEIFLRRCKKMVGGTGEGWNGKRKPKKVGKREWGEKKNVVVMLI
jgi:hypothetical protein